MFHFTFSYTLLSTDKLSTVKATKRSIFVIVAAAVLGGGCYYYASRNDTPPLDRPVVLPTALLLPEDDCGGVLSSSSSSINDSFESIIRNLTPKYEYDEYCQCYNNVDCLDCSCCILHFYEHCQCFIRNPAATCLNCSCCVEEEQDKMKKIIVLPEEAVMALGLVGGVIGAAFLLMSLV
jgi:hypothetical protein